MDSRAGMEGRQRPQDLLTAREARSLERSIRARMVVLSVLVVFAALHLLRLLDPGVIAETDLEAIVTACVGAVALAVAARGHVLARRRQDLALVGTGVVALDIAVLAALPALWLMTGAEDDLLPAFLLKNELFTISVVLIVINALSLQPRYPAFTAAGAVLVHLAVLAFVLADPRVTTSESFQAHFNTPAVNLGLVTVRVGTLVLLGVLLSLITRNARRMVHDAVELQAANTAIREQQAQLVMESRMDAMASLVAGVAHELNTPLGAVSSSLQTAERAAERLGDADAARSVRALAALRDSSAAGRAAVERMSKLVDSLKDFAALDQAEVQLANLEDGLRSTLSLIDHALEGEVEIRLELAGIPELLCRPRELNQVFRTLIVNALEALGGSGTLRIRTRADDGQVRVEIADDGPGMDEAQLAALFELAIAERAQRMGMGMGLVMSKRIVERHGGQLAVVSRPGEGTTFTVVLPRQPPLARPDGGNP